VQWRTLASSLYSRGMKFQSRAVRRSASLLPLTDLSDIVIACRKPYPAYKGLDVLLARFGRAGPFEILSAAWERVLGYGRAELDGRPLFELIHLPRRSARMLICMVLDESEPCPIAFSLSRKDGTQVPLQWYRRFDAYDARVFIAGDPLTGDPLAGARSPRSLTAPEVCVL
jgi:PAS domain S-box-containing protein